MDYVANPAGRPPFTFPTAAQAAERLGHPPAVLAGAPLDLELPTELHTRGSGGTSVDQITLRYTDAGIITVIIATERRSAQPLDLAGAASGALAGSLLSDRIVEPLPDMDARLLGVFASVRGLDAQRRAATTVDGVDYDTVEVTMGDRTAWAFETLTMRVTVAGHRDLLAGVELNWWSPPT